MKDLKITKGEWRIEKKFDYKHGQDVHAICSKFGEEILNEEFITVWTWMIEEEAEANAQLIADAGTTANKSGLFPSELLMQRDELRDALIDLVSECNKWATFNTGTSKEQFENALKAINNTKGE
jgi:hypothetical protein